MATRQHPKLWDACADDVLAISVVTRASRDAGHGEVVVTPGHGGGAAGFRRGVPSFAQ